MGTGIDRYRNQKRQDGKAVMTGVDVNGGKLHQPSEGREGGY